MQRDSLFLFFSKFNVLSFLLVFSAEGLKKQKLLVTRSKCWLKKVFFLLSINGVCKFSRLFFSGKIRNVHLLFAKKNRQAYSDEKRGPDLKQFNREKVY